MPSFQDQIKSKYFEPFCQNLWGNFHNTSKDLYKLKDYLVNQTTDWANPLTEETIDDALNADDSEKLKTLLAPLPLVDMQNIDNGERLGAIKLKELGLSEALSISETGFGDNTSDRLREFCGDGYPGMLQVSNQHGSRHQVNPDKSSTPFALHSIAKVFTGVLICEMIAEGIISKDDLKNLQLPLDPEVVEKLPPKIQKHIQKTTLHQAMTHTSGLSDYLTEYFSSIKKSLESGGATMQNEPEDFLEFVKDPDELNNLFEPGERHFYSNTGILLAGLAAKNLYNRGKSEGEKKTYYEMLQEKVLQPAGIGLFSVSIPEGETITNPRHLEALQLCGNPAAGYWTTAEEMEKFSKHLCERWQDPEFKTAVETYGSEFCDTKTATIGHSGGIPGDKARGIKEGSSSWFSVNLNSGITVVAASTDSNAALLGECICGAVNDAVKEAEQQDTKSQITGIISEAKESETSFVENLGLKGPDKNQKSWVERMRSDPTKGKSLGNSNEL